MNNHSTNPATLSRHTAPVPESAAPGDDALPLAGIRVADFTHVISGPYCTQILADLGATVTKIEGLDHGDIGRDITPRHNGQSHYFTAFNRNKRSIALDLKSPGGRAVAEALVRDADVLIENFAPGVIGRLGFGHEAVRAANPAIIYCSISGFGQTGPLAKKRSLDLVAQAYSGMMSTNGNADGPPLKLGVPIGDTSASLFAAIGILAALYRRRATGHGEYLDIGMYDCLLALLANYGGHVHAMGSQPARTGSLHYFTVPYGAFDAADGQIIIAVMTEPNWQQLCKALDLRELAADPRLQSAAGRSTHREIVYRALLPVLQSSRVAELVERLDAADVPCAPVSDIGAALAHPHTAARGMRLDLAHPGYGALAATALPLRALARRSNTAPPLHGEHTAAVLRELGLTDDAVARLLASREAWQGGEPPRAA